MPFIQCMDRVCGQTQKQCSLMYVVVFAYLPKIIFTIVLEKRLYHGAPELFSQTLVFKRYIF
jgi:hypothetical protein